MAHQTPERAWQQTVVELAETLRYVTNHTYPLRTSSGWRTGTTLVGQPDLVALRPPWCLAIELKAGAEKPTPEQVCVLSLYAALPAGRAWVLSDRAPMAMVHRWLVDPEAAPVHHGFEPISPEEARVELGRLKAARLLRKRSRRGSTTAVPGQLPLGPETL